MSLLPDWLLVPNWVNTLTPNQGYLADVVIQLDVTPEVYEFEVSAPYNDFVIESAEIEFTTEIITDSMEY